MRFFRMPWGHEGVSFKDLIDDRGEQTQLCQDQKIIIGTTDDIPGNITEREATEKTCDIFTELTAICSEQYSRILNGALNLTRLIL